MATVKECERALRSLAQRLAEVDPDQRAKYAVERTVSCSVPDLGVVFTGRVDGDGLTDVQVGDDDEASAQVRLAASSDDLIALSEGRLGVPSAWASGRLKIEASVLDLLKLRSLL